MSSRSRPSSAARQSSSTAAKPTSTRSARRSDVKSSPVVSEARSATKRSRRTDNQPDPDDSSPETVDHVKTEEPESEDDEEREGDGQPTPKKTRGRPLKNPLPLADESPARTTPSTRSSSCTDNQRLSAAEFVNPVAKKQKATSKAKAVDETAPIPSTPVVGKQKATPKSKGGDEAAPSPSTSITQWSSPRRVTGSIESITPEAVKKPPRRSTSQYDVRVSSTSGTSDQADAEAPANPSTKSKKFVKQVSVKSEVESEKEEANQTITEKRSQSRRSFPPLRSSSLEPVIQPHKEDMDHRPKQRNRSEMPIRKSLSVKKTPDTAPKKKQLKHDSDSESDEYCPNYYERKKVDLLKRGEDGSEKQASTKVSYPPRGPSRSRKSMVEDPANSDSGTAKKPEDKTPISAQKPRRSARAVMEEEKKEAEDHLGRSTQKSHRKSRKTEEKEGGEETREVPTLDLELTDKGARRSIKVGRRSDRTVASTEEVAVKEKSDDKDEVDGSIALRRPRRSILPVKSEIDEEEQESTASDNDTEDSEAPRRRSSRFVMDLRKEEEEKDTAPKVDGADEFLVPARSITTRTTKEAAKEQSGETTPPEDNDKACGTLVTKRNTRRSVISAKIIEDGEKEEKDVVDVKEPVPPTTVQKSRRSAHTVADDRNDVNRMTDSVAPTSARNTRRSTISLKPDRREDTEQNDVNGVADSVTPTAVRNARRSARVVVGDKEEIDNNDVGNSVSSRGKARSVKATYDKDTDESAASDDDDEEEESVAVRRIRRSNRVVTSADYRETESTATEGDDVDAPIAARRTRRSYQPVSTKAATEDSSEKSAVIDDASDTSQERRRAATKPQSANDGAEGTAEEKPTKKTGSGPTKRERRTTKKDAIEIGSDDEAVEPEKNTVKKERKPQARRVKNDLTSDEETKEAVSDKSIARSCQPAAGDDNREEAETQQPSRRSRSCRQKEVKTEIKSDEEKGEAEQPVKLPLRRSTRSIRTNSIDDGASRTSQAAVSRQESLDCPSEEFGIVEQAASAQSSVRKVLPSRQESSDAPGEEFGVIEGEELQSTHSTTPSRKVSDAPSSVSVELGFVEDDVPKGEKTPLETPAPHNQPPPEIPDQHQIEESIEAMDDQTPEEVPPLLQESTDTPREELGIIYDPQPRDEEETAAKKSPSRQESRAPSEVLENPDTKEDEADSKATRNGPLDTPPAKVVDGIQETPLAISSANQGEENEDNQEEVEAVDGTSTPQFVPSRKESTESQYSEELGFIDDSELIKGIPEVPLVISDTREEDQRELAAADGVNTPQVISSRQQSSDALSEELGVVDEILLIRPILEVPLVISTATSCTDDVREDQQDGVTPAAGSSSPKAVPSRQVSFDAPSEELGCVEETDYAEGIREIPLLLPSTASLTDSSGGLADATGVDGVTASQTTTHPTLIEQPDAKEAKENKEDASSPSRVLIQISFPTPLDQPKEELKASASHAVKRDKTTKSTDRQISSSTTILESGNPDADAETEKITSTPIENPDAKDGREVKEAAPADLVSLVDAITSSTTITIKNDDSSKSFSADKMTKTIENATQNPPVVIPLNGTRNGRSSLILSMADLVEQAKRNDKEKRRRKEDELDRLSTTAVARGPATSKPVKISHHRHSRHSHSMPSRSDRQAGSSGTRITHTPKGVRTSSLHQRNPADKMKSNGRTQPPNGTNRNQKDNRHHSSHASRGRSTSNKHKTPTRGKSAPSNGENVRSVSKPAKRSKSSGQSVPPPDDTTIIKNLVDKMVEKVDAKLRDRLRREMEKRKKEATHPSTANGNNASSKATAPRAAVTHEKHQDAAGSSKIDANPPTEKKTKDHSIRAILSTPSKPIVIHQQAGSSTHLTRDPTAPTLVESSGKVPNDANSANQDELIVFKIPDVSWKQKLPVPAIANNNRAEVPTTLKPIVDRERAGSSKEKPLKSMPQRRDASAPKDNRRKDPTDVNPGVKNTLEAGKNAPIPQKVDQRAAKRKPTTPTVAPAQAASVNKRGVDKRRDGSSKENERSKRQRKDPNMPKIEKKPTKEQLAREKKKAETEAFINLLGKRPKKFSIRTREPIFKNLPRGIASKLVKNEKKRKREFWKKLREDDGKLLKKLTKKARIAARESLPQVFSSKRYGMYAEDYLIVQQDAKGLDLKVTGGEKKGDEKKGKKEKIKSTRLPFLSRNLLFNRNRAFADIPSVIDPADPPKAFVSAPSLPLIDSCFNHEDDIYLDDPIRKMIAMRGYTDHLLEFRKLTNLRMRRERGVPENYDFSLRALNAYTLIGRAAIFRDEQFVRYIMDAWSKGDELFDEMEKERDKVATELAKVKVKRKERAAAVLARLERERLEAIEEEKANQQKVHEEHEKAQEATAAVDELLEQDPKDQPPADKAAQERQDDAQSVIVLSHNGDNSPMDVTQDRDEAEEVESEPETADPSYQFDVNELVKAYGDGELKDLVFPFGEKRPSWTKYLACLATFDGKYRQFTENELLQASTLPNLIINHEVPIDEEKDPHEEGQNVVTVGTGFPFRNTIMVTRLKHYLLTGHRTAYCEFWYQVWAPDGRKSQFFPANLAIENGHWSHGCILPVNENLLATHPTSLDMRFNTFLDMPEDGDIHVVLWVAFSGDLSLKDGRGRPSRNQALFDAYRSTRREEQFELSKRDWKNKEITTFFGTFHLGKSGKKKDRSMRWNYGVKSVVLIDDSSVKGARTEAVAVNGDDLITPRFDEAAVEEIQRLSAKAHATPFMEMEFFNEDFRTRDQDKKKCPLYSGMGKECVHDPSLGAKGKKEDEKKESSGPGKSRKKKVATGSDSNENEDNDAVLISTKPEPPKRKPRAPKKRDRSELPVFDFVKAFSGHTLDFPFESVSELKEKTDMATSIKTQLEQLLGCRMERADQTQLTSIHRLQRLHFPSVIYYRFPNKVLAAAPQLSDGSSVRELVLKKPVIDRRQRLVRNLPFFRLAKTKNNKRAIRVLRWKDVQNLPLEKKREMIARCSRKFNSHLKPEARTDNTIVEVLRGSDATLKDLAKERKRTVKKLRVRHSKAVKTLAFNKKTVNYMERAMWKQIVANLTGKSYGPRGKPIQVAKKPNQFGFEKKDEDDTEEGWTLEEESAETVEDSQENAIVREQQESTPEPTTGVETRNRRRREITPEPINSPDESEQGGSARTRMLRRKEITPEILPENPPEAMPSPVSHFSPTRQRDSDRGRRSRGITPERIDSPEPILPRGGMAGTRRTAITPEPAVMPCYGMDDDEELEPIVIDKPVQPRATDVPLELVVTKDMTYWMLRPEAGPSRWFTGQRRVVEDEIDVVDFSESEEEAEKPEEPEEPVESEEPEVSVDEDEPEPPRKKARFDMAQAVVIAELFDANGDSKEGANTKEIEWKAEWGVERTKKLKPSKNAQESESAAVKAKIMRIRSDLLEFKRFKMTYEQAESQAADALRMGLKMTRKQQSVAGILEGEYRSEYIMQTFLNMEPWDLRHPLLRQETMDAWTVNVYDKLPPQRADAAIAFFRNKGIELFTWVYERLQGDYAYEHYETALKFAEQAYDMSLETLVEEEEEEDEDDDEEEGGGEEEGDGDEEQEDNADDGREEQDIGNGQVIMEDIEEEEDEEKENGNDYGEEEKIGEEGLVVMEDIDEEDGEDVGVGEEEEQKIDEEEIVGVDEEEEERNEEQEEISQEDVVMVDEEEELREEAMAVEEVEEEMGEKRKKKKKAKKEKHRVEYIEYVKKVDGRGKMSDAVPKITAENSQLAYTIRQSSTPSKCILCKKTCRNMFDLMMHYTLTHIRFSFLIRPDIQKGQENADRLEDAVVIDVHLDVNVDTTKDLLTYEPKKGKPINTITHHDLRKPSKPVRLKSKTGQPIFMTTPIETGLLRSMMRMSLLTFTKEIGNPSAMRRLEADRIYGNREKALMEFDHCYRRQGNVTVGDLHAAFNQLTWNTQFDDTQPLDLLLGWNRRAMNMLRPTANEYYRMRLFLRCNLHFMKEDSRREKERDEEDRMKWLNKVKQTCLERDIETADWNKEPSRSREPRNLLKETRAVIRGLVKTRKITVEDGEDLLRRVSFAQENVDFIGDIDAYNPIKDRNSPLHRYLKCKLREEHKYWSREPAKGKPKGPSRRPPNPDLMSERCLMRAMKKKLKEDKKRAKAIVPNFKKKDKTLNPFVKHARSEVRHLFGPNCTRTSVHEFFFPPECLFKNKTMWHKPELSFRILDSRLGKRAYSRAYFNSRRLKRRADRKLRGKQLSKALQQRHYDRMDLSKILLKE